MIELIQKYLSEPGAVNIAEAIEAAVDAGDLPSGVELLPIRALATALGVSPGTVSAAYRRLQRRGVVLSDGRRGTRVAARPEPAVAAPPRDARLADLAVGNPDPALLPALGPALARLDARPVLYGEPLNHPPLEAHLRAILAAEGIPCEGLAVVGGAMDALERVLREALSPGDRVAVEDPAFSGTLTLLRALSLTPVPVAIDDAGMLPEGLDEALAGGAKAAIVVPRAQNPTGAALDEIRAEALARVLAAHPGALYVEDDHAGPVAGAPALTACRPGRGGQAVIRSFSKSLGPDLRVAALAGDGALIDRIQRRQALGMRWVSHLLQRLACALLTSEEVAASLAVAEATYARRRGALIAALAEEGIPARGRSGLNVWVPVADEATALQGLWAAGYAVSPGSHYRLRSGPAVRVTVSALPEAKAPAFARALGAVLHPSRRSGPS